MALISLSLHLDKVRRSTVIVPLDWEHVYRLSMVEVGHFCWYDQAVLVVVGHQAVTGTDGRVC